jgi:hypothetical protein
LGACRSQLQRDHEPTSRERLSDEHRDAHSAVGCRSAPPFAYPSPGTTRAYTTLQ